MSSTFCTAHPHFFCRALYMQPSINKFVVIVALLSFLLRVLLIKKNDYLCTLGRCYKLVRVDFEGAMRAS